MLDVIKNRLGTENFSFVKGAILSLGSKGSAAAIGFIFSALLAREYGAEGVGLYGIALTSTVILLTIAGLGIDNAILRRCSIVIYNKDFDLFFQYIITGLIIVLSSAAVLAIVQYYGAEFLSQIISKDSSAAFLIRIFAYAIAPMCFMKVLSAALKAKGRIVIAQIVEGMIVPAVGIIAILYIASAEIKYIVYAYVLGTVLAALAGGICLGQGTISRHMSLKGRSDLAKELTKIGTPTLGVVLGSYLTEWVCIFTIARFATVEEVGFFRSCWQITFLLPFVTTATDGVLAPRVASMYDAGHYKDLARLIRLALFGIFMCVLPVAVILIFAGDYVLQIYGSDFIVAAPILAILAGGQLINSTFGLSGKILFLTGFEKKSFKNSMMGAVLIVIFALILVPEYGAIGAAISAALTQIIRCLSATIIVARMTGINIVTGKVRFKGRDQ